MTGMNYYCATHLNKNLVFFACILGVDVVVRILTSTNQANVSVTLLSLIAKQSLAPRYATAAASTDVCEWCQSQANIEERVIRTTTC